MNVVEQIKADFLAAVAAYGAQFEWQGTHHACVRNDQPSGLTLVSGGFVDGVNYTLVVSKEEFHARYPQNGDLVNYGTAQILRTLGADDPALAHVELWIGSIQQP